MTRWIISQSGNNIWKQHDSAVGPILSIKVRTFNCVAQQTETLCQHLCLSSCPPPPRSTCGWEHTSLICLADAAGDKNFRSFLLIARIRYQIPGAKTIVIPEVVLWRRSPRELASLLKGFSTPTTWYEPRKRSPLTDSPDGRGLLNPVRPIVFGPELRPCVFGPCKHPSSRLHSCLRD